MQIIRGLVNLRPSSRGLALTIGNFDGVHLGHRAILDRLRERARALDVPTAVVTFEPTPREYFDPAHAPARLMRLRDKAAALDAAGVDRLVLLRFDERLRALSADDFAEQVLAGALAARHVVIGAGFRFGRGRSGTVDLLAGHGRRLGFSVDAVAPVMPGRRAGQLDARARGARGRRPAYGAPPARSRLQHERTGDRRPQARPRRSAMPTANMRLHRRVTPLSGIFAVRVRGLGEGALARCRVARHAADASVAANCCSRRTCSISAATCTAAISRSSSSRGCATS
jgi:riboflavin kinase / FMN adenylyltransferase